jgi:hypothetical protein
VLTEIKLSERMKEIKVPVEADMLIAEILPLVRSHLINTFSVRSTPCIFALRLRHNFFFSSDACDGLSDFPSWGSAITPLLTREL